MQLYIVFQCKIWRVAELSWRVAEFRWRVQKMVEYIGFLIIMAKGMIIIILLIDMHNALKNMSVHFERVQNILVYFGCVENTVRLDKTLQLYIN